MKKIAVIGIGNILLRDDGVGVHTINELISENSISDIEFIDGGTSIFDLLSLFIENNEIIIVDSLKGGYDPGTVYKITPEELGSVIKANSSLHDVQVLDIIKQANLMGHFPSVTIIGVEPKEIYFHMELSVAIKNELPNVIKIVKQEIENKIGEQCA